MKLPEQADKSNKLANTERGREGKAAKEGKAENMAETTDRTAQEQHTLNEKGKG